MEIMTEVKEGILLVDKPQGRTSFSLIRSLTKLTHIKKIGHAGTLDPFATGVMVMLIGKQYTKLSDKLLFEDKEYEATAYLGATTDSYDRDGKIVGRSKKIPSSEDVYAIEKLFQGEIQQIPPMFSAKKVQGKKLYEYARKGIEIPRKPSTVKVCLKIQYYEYPKLFFTVACSKGTYIRSIAHEIGVILGCGAYLEQLRRSRSGQFLIENCVDGNLLDDKNYDITPHLIHTNDKHSLQD